MFIGCALSWNNNEGTRFLMAMWTKLSWTSLIGGSILLAMMMPLCLEHVNCLAHLGWIELSDSVGFLRCKVAIDPPPIPRPRKPPDPVTQIQADWLLDLLILVPKSHGHDYQRKSVINSVNPVEFQRESSVVNQREQMSPLFSVNPGEFQRECHDLSPREQ